MKIINWLGLWFLTALVTSIAIPAIPKQKDVRCRRFVFLIPIIVGAAVAGSGIALIVEEQQAAKLNRDLNERYRTSTTPTTRKITTPSTVTTSKPTTKPTASTVTAPKPTTKPYSKILLLNYDLDVYNHIPRGLILFQVQELPAFNGRYDAEYISINPHYLGTTNPDRYQRIFRFSDLEIRDDNDLHRMYDFNVDTDRYLRQLYRIRNLIKEFQDLSGEIHNALELVNERLRHFQYQRFVRRAGDLDAGRNSQPLFYDQELHDAFNNEVQSVMRLLDRRTAISGLLIHEVRNRECLAFGLDMRRHARQSGVIHLPRFYLHTSLLGYTELSPEELRWMQNPTTDWFPRQNYINANFENSAPDHPERPGGRIIMVPSHTETFLSGQANHQETGYTDPTYRGYQSVLPSFGARSFVNDQVNVEFAMFPDRDPDHPNYSPTQSGDNSHDSQIFEQDGSATQSENTINVSSGSDSIPLISLDDSVVASNTILLSDSNESVVEIVAEINRTQDEDNPQPGTSRGTRRQGCDSNYYVQFKKRKHDERRDRRSISEMPIQEIATCHFVGGYRFRLMLSLWHKF